VGKRLQGKGKIRNNRFTERGVRARRALQHWLDIAGLAHMDMKAYLDFDTEMQCGIFDSTTGEL
jgi:hypothetical protein